MTEPWMMDALRQKKWDDYLSVRPVCSCCGYPILDEKCLVLEENRLCMGCVEARTVYIEEV